MLLERQQVLDEKLLNRLLWYFTTAEKCVLAQVCKTWRKVLYQPKFWEAVTPILHAKELYTLLPNGEKEFVSLQAFALRGFQCFCLVGVSDLDICEFIDNYPLSKKGVRSVSLKRSTITDVMLEQMQGLMHLELSGCNDFTEAGLWSSLNARLTSLSVSDCINVADDAIAAISQLLPNLSELSLQAYHVTDTAMAYFTAKQGYTTHTLRLHSCWEITNHGVVNMVHSLPNLTALSLSGCSKITDDGVELVAENLRKLRSLDLSWCPRITDMALEYIACDLHKLEELVLDRLVCLWSFHPCGKADRCNHTCNRLTGIAVTHCDLNKLLSRRSSALSAPQHYVCVRVCQSPALCQHAQRLTTLRYRNLAPFGLT
uniref:F-box and leucine-rich repeat protein 16 n=1 Tax=Sander lucioperca TaxID=283035 RepID=A0A8D0DAK0_SANLU